MSLAATIVIVEALLEAFHRPRSTRNGRSDGIIGARFASDRVFAPIFTNDERAGAA